jgi:hypothetical protein
MNPVDRLLNQYETIVHNQAVAQEQHGQMIAWLMIGAALAVVVLILQGAILSVKIATRRDVREWKQDQKDSLEIIKGWVYSAQANAKDAKSAMNEVKETTKAIVHPSREDKQIAAAVEAIPEKTADRVVEKLGGSDAIKKLLLPPLLATLAVAGTALAGGPAAAADELRRVNAERAAEWAAGLPDSR